MTPTTRRASLLMLAVLAGCARPTPEAPSAVGARDPIEAYLPPDRPPEDCSKYLRADAAPVTGGSQDLSGAMCVSDNWHNADTAPYARRVAAIIAEERHLPPGSVSGVLTGQLPDYPAIAPARDVGMVSAFCGTMHAKPGSPGQPVYAEILISALVVRPSVSRAEWPPGSDYNPLGPVTCLGKPALPAPPPPQTVFRDTVVMWKDVNSPTGALVDLAVGAGAAEAAKGNVSCVMRSGDRYVMDATAALQAMIHVRAVSGACRGRSGFVRMVDVQ